jgi:hypothetical protein
MDLSGWSTDRPWVFGALLGGNVSLALWITVRRQSGAAASPYDELIRADAGVIFLASVALFIVRKRVLANAADRVSRRRQRPDAAAFLIGE